MNFLTNAHASRIQAGISPLKGANHTFVAINPLGNSRQSITVADNVNAAMVCRPATKCGPGMRSAAVMVFAYRDAGSAGVTGLILTADIYRWQIQSGVAVGIRSDSTIHACIVRCRRRCI